MRMLVTGREGQVVRSLLERGPFTDIEIAALGRPDLDLGGSEDSIASTIQAAAPDVIVSAAAYTFVDKAESEPDLAYAVNERGPASIARTARKLGIPVIHLSTDYVFDGMHAQPYAESDPTAPTGVYGASKLAGEKAVAATLADTAILRTAWVYSPFGANFVKTMLRLATDRDEIAVVADQRGNPTNALDIADGVIRVAENLASSNDPSQRGIFHMTADGDASWAEFAESIFEASAAAGGPTARVRRIATAEYPTAAQRPANSRLNAARLEQAHGVRLRPWRESLTQVVERLVRTQ